MRFSDATKNKARLRQWGRCALCGRDLSYAWEEAHHIQPDALGGKDEPENCVILCDVCHQRAHHDGNYRSLVVAPRSYYKYFDGRG